MYTTPPNDVRAGGSVRLHAPGPKHHLELPQQADVRIGEACLERALGVGGPLSVSSQPYRIVRLARRYEEVGV